MTNNELKIYSSLKYKKHRQAQGLFLVEGLKVIEELLKSNFEIVKILSLEEVLNRLEIDNYSLIEQVNFKTLSRISNMKTSTDVIAIVKLPKPKLAEKTPKTILIDTIQDPGNLGTIIRTAHWFGFNQIICSDNSVDLFNYKVIQASMGAVFKIKVSYVNLENFIPQLQDNGFRILGAFMSGASIYDFKFSNNDIFILGNEGRGISTKIEKLIDQKITIPSFAKGDKTESLNISIAGAVICSEMAKSFES